MRKIRIFQFSPILGYFRRFHVVRKCRRRSVQKFNVKQSGALTDTIGMKHLTHPLCNHKVIGEDPPWFRVQGGLKNEKN